MLYVKCSRSNVLEMCLAEFKNILVLKNIFYLFLPFHYLCMNGFFQTTDETRKAFCKNIALASMILAFHCKQVLCSPRVHLFTQIYKMGGGGG